MKIFKKFLCTFLIVVMCLTVAPLDGFVGVDLFVLSEWFSSEASALEKLDVLVWGSSGYSYIIDDIKAACDGLKLKEFSSINYSLSKIRQMYDLSKLGFVMVFLPEYSISSDDLNALKELNEAGVHIMFVGEHDGYSSINWNISVAAKNLGFNISFSSSGHTSAGVGVPVSINSNSPLLKNVTELAFVCAGNISQTDNASEMVLCENMVCLVGKQVGNGYISVVSDCNVFEHTNDSYRHSSKENLTNFLLNCYSMSTSTNIGQCGDNAYYTYNAKTQKLVISGYGPMWDYEVGKSPFVDMEINEVVIKDEVSSIGAHAFAGCKSLKVVRFRENIKSIGISAFDECDLVSKGGKEFKEERGIYYFGTYEEFGKTSVLYPNETLSKAKITCAYSCKAYENEEADSTKNVFDGKSIALTDHIVPGIYDDMIPQGLAYYKEKNWFLISAYHKTEGTANPGVIYALDAGSGEFIAQFNLYDVGDGEPCTAHLGGIAVSDNNVYVTYYDNDIAYLPLEEINVDKYTVKDIRLSGYLEIKPLAEAANKNGDNPAYTAYIEVCDGVLWTGNFYNGNVFSSIGWLPESYGYKATKKNNTIIVGYPLSGSNSKDEWTSIDSKEKYRIKLANDVNSIQGATIDNDKLYLSVTTGASFGAEVWAANLRFNDKNIAELKKKDFTYKGKNIDGAEEIVVVDGYLYSVYESAALSNHGDFFWGDSLKSTSGAMTEVKLSDLKAKTKNIFNCPIDIEVIDSANGEVVCRIVNNIVDEEIASKENALLAEVVGDTKYIYTPNDKNYEFIITGNGTGKMDYTVVKVDEDGYETERINFFDVEITEETELFGNLELSDEQFELSDYSLEGTASINATEYMASASEELNINISAAVGGYVIDSIECISGDVVEISASCDEGYAFDGWYENNNFVSDDMEYTFVAKSDRTLEARFKHVDHNYLDGVCQSCGDDKTDDCSCRCHKTGFISRLIWKFLNFFNKIFRKNQFCEYCGVKHY